MSKKNTTAIPAPVETEYDGTVFRSKTEAMFAWSMTESGIAWAYETKTIDGYTPDFEIWFRDSDENRLRHMWIELKPSIPTGSYVARTTKKLLSLCNSEDRFVAIVCGSPYSEQPTKVLVREFGVGKPEKVPEWITNTIGVTLYYFLEESRDQRFDLAA